MNLDPPVPKSLTSDPTSFAHTSARSRWPAIITSAIDDVHRTISSFPSSSNSTSDQIDDTSAGKTVLSALSTLKYELQHNRPLTALPNDGSPDYATYNDELAARASSTKAAELRWHDVEWLYAECYLYRRMSSIFKSGPSSFWKGYDCFRRQKMSTFRSSRGAVVELASRYGEVVKKIRQDGSVVAGDGKEGSKEQEDAAEEVLFREMAEICLWGNATDLSLLTSLTYEDIQKLQGSHARKESESKILVNDLSAAFAVLNAAKNSSEKKENRRVDIVLDNAGFELFVDLVLAGYMIETGLATEVVLHPKSIPWFVSDVVPKDFVDLLEVLRDPKRFYEGSGADETAGTSNANDTVALSEQEIADLKFLFEHWSSLHEEGKLILRPNAFWTAAGSFWRMTAEKDLLEDLRESELVIFKGDLNYRKLVGDAIWPPTTPFQEAIGPLGAASNIRTLALRTCKADVVVGLPEGKDEEIRAIEGGGGDSGARKWAWSGKWAVVSFCDGKL